MDSLKSMSDEQVWRLFREGNRLAFEEMYSRYHPVLSAYGMRLTGDSDLVADAVQNLFVKLIRNCRNLKQTDNVKYYLLSAIRHRIFDEYQKIHPSVPLESGEAFFTYSPDTPEAAFGDADDERMEKTARLEKLLEHLSSRQKEILYLYYVKGLSHQQIAEMLGINRQSSKNLLFRTVSRLKNSLFVLSTLFIFTVLSMYYGVQTIKGSVSLPSV